MKSWKEWKRLLRYQEAEEVERISAADLERKRSDASNAAPKFNPSAAAIEAAGRVITWLKDDRGVPQKVIDALRGTLPVQFQAAIDAAYGAGWNAACGKVAEAESRPAQDKQRTKHVTIESGHDPRLFSDTYATPLRIHIGDDLVYDSESRPSQEESKVYGMFDGALRQIHPAQEHCGAEGRITVKEFFDPELRERRAVFVYEAARLENVAAGRPINPEPWIFRDFDFRKNMIQAVDDQCGESRLDSPEALHDKWVKAYETMGWKYGKHRDPIAKTHPDMVPFDQLGQKEQEKDWVFFMLCEIARRIT